MSPLQAAREYVKSGLQDELDEVGKSATSEWLFYNNGTFINLMDKDPKQGDLFLVAFEEEVTALLNHLMTVVDDEQSES